MRRILAAGGFLAVIALAAAAPALANSDTVAISVHGTSFTGTVENTGTKAHNFIAIGTAAQEGNPIETFLIEGGRDCHKYAGAGSIYCMAMIKPGQTVSFRGTTMMPTTSFQFSTSDDHGVDNATYDVKATTGAPPPTTAPTTAPTTTAPTTTAPGASSAASSGSSNVWIWIVLGIVAFLLVGAFLWWLNGQFGSDDGDDDDDDEDDGEIQARLLGVQPKPRPIRARLLAGFGSSSQPPESPQAVPLNLPALGDDPPDDTVPVGPMPDPESGEGEGEDDSKPFNIPATPTPSDDPDAHDPDDPDDPWSDEYQPPPDEEPEPTVPVDGDSSGAPAEPEPM